MTQSGTTNTPLPTSIQFHVTTDANKFDQPELYRAAIGSLMYAAIGTRPDIAYAIQSLSQFSHNLSSEHWHAVKHLFRYLQGTKDMGIMYDQCGGSATTAISGFSDADWASNEIDRKSISRYTFLMGGGAISWTSKKQSIMALLSMEAEYIAATLATKQIIWLRDFLTALGFTQADPSELHIDNQSAIALAANPQFHARSKHIDVQFHFIRGVIQREIATIHWCPTDEMTADIFTKSLLRPKFKSFRDDLGMVSV